MPRVRRYTKNIACLESLWDSDLENRLTMLPILELTARVSQVKFIYLTCNTKAELRHNLSLLGPKKNYGVLLFAFHGVPGEIELASKDNVNLEHLATMMRKRFSGWVVHFASCGTIKADKDRLAEFVEKTGVAMVTGYTKQVDWTDGAVMDLLLLRWLQHYLDLHALIKHLRKHFPDVIEVSGFQSFPED